MLDSKLKSFGYALKGIRIAYSEEFNFRVHIALGILTFAAGWYFNISRLEWIAVFGACGLVLTAETFNTALEELCDMLRTTHDPHVEKIKDLAAGAVFISTLAALSIGIAIFLPKVLAL